MAKQTKFEKKSLEAAESTHDQLRPYRKEQRERIGNEKKKRVDSILEKVVNLANKADNYLNPKEEPEPEPKPEPEKKTDIANTVGMVGAGLIAPLVIGDWINDYEIKEDDIPFVKLMKIIGAANHNKKMHDPEYVSQLEKTANYMDRRLKNMIPDYEPRPYSQVEEGKKNIAEQEAARKALVERQRERFRKRLEDSNYDDANVNMYYAWQKQEDPDVDLVAEHNKQLKGDK